MCNNTPAEFCSSIINVGWVGRSETRHNGGCHFVLPYESKKGEFQTINLKQLPRWLREHYLVEHYLVTGLLILSGLSQSLFAATITVNSLEDTTLADGQCTLREALENANQDTAGIGDCIAGRGNDVIDLMGLNGTIILSSELKITSNLIVEGPGRRS